MEKVNKLVTIWEGIPNAVAGQFDFTQKEIINRFMDVFHFGAYFFVIFNTHTAQMEYTDPKIEQLLGYKPEEFELSLVLENIHPDDLPYYYHYEQSAVRFFTGLPADLHFKYKFAYDYRLKTKDGNYKRVQQQIVPVQYLTEGGARTVGIFTDLSHLGITGTPKLSFIGMQGAPSYYNVHQQEEFQLSRHLFSKREQEILQYVVQGMKSEEIAERLHRSVFTIQTHRKSILKKSGCTNLRELLVKSIREGWV